jgi:argininosuccinate lyase
MTVNEDVMKASLSSGFLNATDLADYLVFKGLSFRESHNIVGKMTNYCISKNKALEDLEFLEFKSFSCLFEEDVYDFIEYEAVIERKSSVGSTKKEHVAFAIKSGYEFLKTQ